MTRELLTAERSDALQLIASQVADLAAALRSGGRGDGHHLRAPRVGGSGDRRRTPRRTADELLEDRARIARDLHDHVIRQLFAAGMALQSAAATAADPRAVERIRQVAGTIDNAITQIRTSSFQLRPESAVGAGVRSAVLDVAAELSETLPLDPVIHFPGRVDIACGDAALVDDVSAVIRESLIDVARHARADGAGSRTSRCAPRTEVAA